MEIDEFSRTFFQMEIEEGLFFTHTPSGDPFWDVVRFETFLSLFQEISEPEQRHSSAASRPLLSTLTKIHRLPLKIGSMANQWVRLKRIRPADFVAYINSRYKDVNGKPTDYVSDDALHTLSEFGSILRVESSRSSLLQDVNYSAVISVAFRAYLPPASYEQCFRDVASVIADSERKYFGVIDPHLFDVIRRAYKLHMAERRIWREILDRSQPRLVLMLMNGIQKGLIFEARKRHIPVVECQHGVINLMHPAYSYPPNLSPGEEVILPDVLLLFSDYWKHQCYMPGTKMLVVGNDHFTSKGVRSTRTGAAVFVGAGSFQKYLSPLAVKVAQSLPDRPFIMKLHPTQLSDRAKIEKEYKSIPNLVVVGIEKSVPELMADASDVVIIQSTASYEALDRGVPVHVLQKDGYMSHKDLFLRPDVRLFSTAKELQSALFKPINRPESVPRFFDAFNPVVFRELVRTLH